MKKRLVWRYTCEFCKKANCSAPSIAKHELHCTKNPARVCRMCMRVGEKQPPISELIAAIHFVPVTEFLDIQIQERRLDRVRIAARNCPACILAAIRQSINPEEGVYGDDGGWKWKDERQAWIEDYRAACYSTESYDMVFDRKVWLERRAKRYPQTVSATP